MSNKVILVSCVSKKLPLASPAASLYQSDWFLKASRYAAQNTDRWFILSAKYGLVHPEQVLEPYNVTLKTMGKAERRFWARNVFTELKPQLNAGDTIVFLAGTAYREFLADHISRAGFAIEIPMEGLGIGQQLSWLKQRI